jgi:hypothetical protein
MGSKLSVKITISLVVMLLIVVPLISLMGKHSMGRYKTIRQSRRVLVSSPFQHDTFTIDHTKKHPFQEPRFSHRIIIDNIRDPQQLEQILRIIENYTATNEIKDLNITCTNKKN